MRQPTSEVRLKRGVRAKSRGSRGPRSCATSCDAMTTRVDDDCHVSALARFSARASHLRQHEECDFL
eukprot:5033603-Pleurochrysis_carterae.AAC.3